MIVSFRNRSLKRFWERNDLSRLPPDRIARVSMLLDRLDASATPADMNLPGFGFHQLTGRNKGRYAVSVSANWRITLGWSDQDAVDVDFEDYR
ncbi:MAG: type II toxin-antitoxin system RelE/ParE family toxin [Pseudomonadota bacterium]